MKINKYYIISIILLIVQLGVVLWIGSQLPADAKIPIHWNYRNQIDNYADKTQGMFLLWGFNAGLFLLMVFLRRYSPVYQQEREKNNNAIPLLTMGLVFFLGLIQIYSLLLALHPDSMGKFHALYILIGLLFMFLGNIMPKLSRNYFAGIKTPWTYYSDEIWRKTSRLGGFCFFITGFVFALAGIFNLKETSMSLILIIMVGTTVVLPIFYSFLLYLKAKK
ncbi:MAG TPA: SdpI family protein [Candidatus Cloacimonadota bacterium]|nr:SdpI family protein [Candidatus Cloacimonadota bacterium]